MSDDCEADCGKSAVGGCPTQCVMKSKDAVIKALADALMQNGKQRIACPSCHIATPGHSKGCNVAATLRLAGRL